MRSLVKEQRPGPEADLGSGVLGFLCVEGDGLSTSENLKMREASASYLTTWWDLESTLSSILDTCSPGIFVLVN